MSNLDSVKDIEEILKSPHGQALRLLNLFRLFIAAVFLFFGSHLGLGGEAPSLYLLASLTYFFCVLALGFPDAVRKFGFLTLANTQFLIDIPVFTLLLHASGGAGSGIAVLIMVLLAGAGLICRGRMVLLFAALASILILGENITRALSGHNFTDFSAVGMLCVSFFGVALLARVLAHRAQYNETLAQARGVALHREEAVSERIIREMKEGVIVVDGQGIILKSNPQAAMLMGCTLPEGMPLNELDENIQTLFESTALPEAETCGRFALSSTVLRCRVIKTDQKEQGAVLFLSDYAEMQHAAQQIKLAALGRLTASIAHEIRNPLSAISQATELMEGESDANMQMRFQRIVLDNVARIERLVKDILSLGRRAERQPEAVLLQRFIQEFLANSEFGLGQDQALAKVEVDPDVQVAFDPMHLNQILWNVVSNARRYCSGRPGAISIWSTASNMGRLNLHIIDDGPGINEADQDKIFEPFFTTHSKGTGLGMYIAKELAEANGATLSFVPGKGGAHFCISVKVMYEHPGS